MKIVLPFGAGGVADVTSRIMAAKLTEKFGQQVVIENMPGPGGINAARAVINAPPDGYTMALVTNGTSISVAAFNKLPFDPVKEFEMVSMVGTFDLVFAVDAKSEYKTLGDFIKAAKANPGKLNVGTILLGGTQNLGAELFKSMAGAERAGRGLQEFAGHRGGAVAQRRADDDRFSARGAGPGQRRQGAPAGDLVAEALGPAAECADRRRGRRQGLRGDLVERRRGAQGHAEGGHRHHEQGHARGAGDRRKSRRNSKRSASRRMPARRPS